MCRNTAHWVIEFGNGPDDYTESCNEHLGELAEGCVVAAEENIRKDMGAGLRLGYSANPETERQCCWMPAAVAAGKG